MEQRGQETGDTRRYTAYSTVYLVLSTEYRGWLALGELGCFGLRNATRQVHKGNNCGAGDDEHEQAHDRHVRAMREDEHLGKKNGPDHAGRAARKIEKAKKLGRFRGGSHRTHDGTTDRLRAAHYQ